MAYSFSELQDAVHSCSSYQLKQSTDDEGETTFLLLDGCGDQDGDPFYDLIDVQDYVPNNQEVFNYLYQYNR